jgi:hypothetical protein
LITQASLQKDTILPSSLLNSKLNQELAHRPRKNYCQLIQKILVHTCQTLSKQVYQEFLIPRCHSMLRKPPPWSKWDKRKTLCSLITTNQRNH